MDDLKIFEKITGLTTKEINALRTWASRQSLTLFLMEVEGAKDEARTLLSNRCINVLKVKTNSFPKKEHYPVALTLIAYAIVKGKMTTNPYRLADDTEAMRQIDIRVSRMDAVKSEKKRMSKKSAYNKIRNELVPLIKILRTVQKLSWQGVADYLRKHEEVSVNKDYLRRTIKAIEEENQLHKELFGAK